MFRLPSFLRTQPLSPRSPFPLAVLVVLSVQFSSSPAIPTSDAVAHFRATVHPVVPVCDPGGGTASPSGSLRTAPEILAQGRRHPDRSVRIALYTRVRETAEARIEADAEDLEARWWRVAAMGLLVDDGGARQQVVLAGEIRREAIEILSRDPTHPGGHHALGRLHSGVVRLNPVLRFFALRLFGEAELQEATWEAAEEHMNRAKAAVPCALVHRWELSRSYAYQRKDAEALDELDALLALPDRAPHDPEIRAMAERLRSEVQRRSPR